MKENEASEATKKDILIPQREDPIHRSTTVRPRTSQTIIQQRYNLYNKFLNLRVCTEFYGNDQ